jgi:hypothetical protein
MPDGSYLILCIQGTWEAILFQDQINSEYITNLLYREPPSLPIQLKHKFKI